MPALASIRIVGRDRVRPLNVIPRKEATHEGITFRVPAEYDGGVWDDIGLRVALRAGTLEPVSARVPHKEKRGLDLVEVVVRWEDWDRISAWVDDALPSYEQSAADGKADGHTLVRSGLRRFRAPRDARATDMFLPQRPHRSTTSEDTQPEVILRSSRSASPAPLPPGAIELRLIGEQPKRDASPYPDCEFLVPFHPLCMTLCFDARHLSRWHEIRDAALALVETMVVDGGNKVPR